MSEVDGLIKIFEDELCAWDDLDADDDTELVEPFPEYKGKLKVGDLRRLVMYLKGINQ